MFDDVLMVIVKAVYWLLVPAALLRFHMQAVRVPFRNPVGAFICAMTDWLVLPLRRISRGALSFFGFDWASLAAAGILELGLSAVFALATGRVAMFTSGMLAAAWLVNGLFGLVTTILTLMLWLTVICAVLSWMRADSVIGDVFDAMTSPWLKPFRRRLPLAGGFDLSPLVLIVLLQIGLLMIGRLQGAALLALR